MRQARSAAPGALAAVLVACAVFLVTRNVGVYTTHAGHHWFFNNFRISALANAFAGGASGRWIASLAHGWGMPLFYYTAPFPYVLAALLKLLGLKTIVTLNALWFIGIVGSSASIYLCSRKLFGRPASVLTAVCALYAPYHLSITFVRNNIGESFAAIFLPLLFAALVGSPSGAASGILLGALAISGIALSHLLSCMMTGLGFGVFVLLFAAFMGFRDGLRIILSAAAMAALGLGLAAFFWIPAWFDLSAVRGLASLTNGYNDYRLHFVKLPQLLSLRWGYGISMPGPDDGMSFSLSPVILTAVLLALASLALSSTRGGKGGAHEPPRPAYERRVVAAVIAGTLTAFALIYLTTEYSRRLWEAFPVMAVLQFPWRFHLLSSFFLAIAAGSASSFLAGAITGSRDSGLAWLFSLLLSVTVIWAHWHMTGPAFYELIPSEDDVEEVIKRKAVYAAGDEFLPPVGEGESGADEREREGVAAFCPAGSEVCLPITGGRLGDGRITVNLEAAGNGTLALYQYWHPAWQCALDGAAVPVRPNAGDPLEVLAVGVPAGTHRVDCRFGFSKSGRTGLVLSIFSGVAAVFIAFALNAVRKRRPRPGARCVTTCSGSRTRAAEREGQH